MTTLDDIRQKHSGTIEEMMRADICTKSVEAVTPLTLRCIAALTYKLDTDYLLPLDEVLTQVAAAIERSKPITTAGIEAMKWCHAGNGISTRDGRTVAYKSNVPDSDALDIIAEHNSFLDAIIARLPKGEA